MKRRFLLLAAAAALQLAGNAMAQATIVMASTTSTEQSGLFGHLLPEFTKATGIGVKVVAVGTGQAIDMAKRGDADVLFVHDTAAEEKYVAEGYAPRPIAKPASPGRGVILTSGTTGTPKGAQRSSAGTDLQSVLGLFDMLPIRVGARTLVAAPMFHSWGLAQLLIGSMLGSTFILQRRFDPEATLAAMDRHRAELLVVVRPWFGAALGEGQPAEPSRTF